MNPVLVEAVRLRMRAETTEHLLALWETNDRVMWSPEAFEAIKSLLIDRGVRDLPPQKPPAPLAERHRPGVDPLANYWLGWLRPVLWIGISIAFLNLASAGAGFFAAWDRLTVGEMMRETMREPWAASHGLMRTLLLPAWLLVGSVACLRLEPAARRLLVLYAVVALAIGAATALYLIWNQWSRWRGPEAFSSWQLMFMLSQGASGAQSLVLPAILFVLLRRPEIRSIFTPASGVGFEPTLSNLAAAAPPTAPSETPPGPASPAATSSTAGRY